jgi:PKD repeat protein/N-acetylmuramoyl-L-alanine amidase
MRKRIGLNIFLLIIVKISFSQVIVIDPGHNDHDCEYPSCYKTNVEVNTNWDVAVRLENMINNYCALWFVEKTKDSFDDDEEIDAREAWANTVDLGTNEDVYFLSIHCNALGQITKDDQNRQCNFPVSDASVTGTESFYCNNTYNSDNAGLLQYAENINDNIILFGDWHDRQRCVEDYTYFCNRDANGDCTTYYHLGVLDGLTMPNCLNEIGFGTTPGDIAKLENPIWRHEFAYGYFNAFKETIDEEDDLGIVSLVLPSSDGEFTANEEIKIRIRNHGFCSIDFGDNPFTFQVNVVGPNSYTYTQELNTGDLEPTNEMDFTITNTCDLTELGEYCFNISITEGEDGNEDNNTLLDQCVNSLQLLTPDFTYDRSYGELPLAVTFSDVTQGEPDNWYWDFGDGNISTSQVPTNTYTIAGKYNVTLSVSKGGSEPVSVTKEIEITDQLLALFSASATSGAFPLVVNFTDESEGTPNEWSWNFGDGGTSTEKHPSHTFTSEGNYTVNLTVHNGIYSDAADPININTYHPDITISGQVVEFLEGVSGLTVKAIEINTETVTSSTTTNSNGDYQLTVPYGWSGKVLVEGGSGYTDYYVNYTNLTQDKTGVTLLISKVEITISKTLIEGTYYKFTANGLPIGSTGYKWTCGDGNEYTTSIFYHYFDCYPTQDESYTVSLTVSGDKTFIAKPLSFIVPRCVTVTSVATYDDCNLIPLGSEAILLDNSYPFTDISKFKIYWGEGSSQTWDTENCQGSSCFDKDHKIYTNNCKTFKYIYNSAGHFTGYLEAYNLASQKNTDYFSFDVVDCASSIISSNLANAYFYTSNELDYYYAGSYNLTNLDAITDYANKKVAITACNNIVLKPGITIKPNSGKQFVLSVSSCLDQNNNKSIKSDEQEPWEFEDIEYYNPNCENIEIYSTLTEVDDILNSEVEIYPNPNTGEFKMVFFNSINIHYIEIYNVGGILVERKYGTENNKYDFNISDKSSGLYLVKVFYDNKIETFKIIYQ